MHTHTHTHVCYSIKPSYMLDTVLWHRYFRSSQASLVSTHFTLQLPSKSCIASSGMNETLLATHGGISVMDSSRYPTAARILGPGANSLVAKPPGNSLRLLPVPEETELGNCETTPTPHLPKLGFPLSELLALAFHCCFYSG